MIFIWYSYGRIHKIFIWYSYDLHMIFSYEIHMIFIWYSYCWGERTWYCGRSTRTESEKCFFSSINRRGKSFLGDDPLFNSVPCDIALQYMLLCDIILYYSIWYDIGVVMFRCDIHLIFYDTILYWCDIYYMILCDSILMRFLWHIIWARGWEVGRSTYVPGVVVVTHDTKSSINQSK